MSSSDLLVTKYFVLEKRRFEGSLKEVDAKKTRVNKEILMRNVSAMMVKMGEWQDEWKAVMKRKSDNRNCVDLF